jgi:MYXO-CTERM domain-containing protein
MKTAYAILTMTAMSASMVATAEAGVVHYSFEADATTVSMGDTVHITVHASIDPQGDPFNGLAGATFDIHIADPITSGGMIDKTPPILGLKPDFSDGGNQGTLSGSSILGVFAFQFPPFMGPINTGTELELYSFTYTITEADQREIMLNVSALQSQVYTNDIPPMTYDSMSSPLFLQVVQAPTPGALALLGLAGLVGNSRRRKI